MPNDKKSSKDGKKKEGTSEEVEVVVKRKSSIVDSSGGSSSSSSSSASSSDNSGNSSEHGSQAGDSDAYDNEKGTMTNDSQEGTSSSIACTSSSVTIQPYQVEIVDRTEEMQFLMNGGQKGQNVKLVTEKNGVPISESTHFTPISSSDVPTTSAASQPATNGIKQNGKPVVKGGCKQKQLTKKQRKELEKREKEQAGAPTTYPGQREPAKKAPIQHLCHNEKHIEMHHFDESASEGCPDGEVIVRGTNAAAQAMMNTTENVQIPFLRNEEELGKRVHYVDLHKNAQMRYLRFTNPLGTYTKLDPKIKALHRMGFGIAASGIPDSVPLTLSINGAKHFMKDEYSDGSKIHNWRADFDAQADMDSVKPEEFREWQALIGECLDNVINNTSDKWRAKTLRIIRDSDLRQVLLRFGEIERLIARMEAKRENRCIDFDNLTFANRTRSDRMQFIVCEMLGWGSQRFDERFEETIVEKRAYSILMHLASTAANEKPCHEDRHRKCTILHYFLSQSGDHKIHWLKHKFSGGNTILHFAAMTGSPCQIDVLLRMGAPLNELNDLFKSPVALAIRRHQSLIVRQLMWYGADIGGSLSLKHITPRSHRDGQNKAVSDYEDAVANSTPNKSREFVISRLKALSMTFSSWVESFLLDAEARLRLGVGNLKSGLHQIRIGPDMFDVERKVAGRIYRYKKLNMTIESSESPEPIVLFLIPCRYTHFDTTMHATNPHIVRIPMLTDSHAVAQRIAEKEKIRVAAGDNRVEYTQDIKNCRPVRVLGMPVSVSSGDSCTEGNQILESFLSYEHNGALYAYVIPNSLAHSSNPYTNVTVTLTIPEFESEKFRDAFFMVQAIQIVKMEPPKPLADADPSLVAPSLMASSSKASSSIAPPPPPPPPPVPAAPKFKTVCSEEVLSKIAKRKNEIIAVKAKQDQLKDGNLKDTVAKSKVSTVEAASSKRTVPGQNVLDGPKPKPKTE